MKIAIFTPNLSRKCSGGAETYSLNIATVLSVENEVTIYTCANYRKDFDINKIYQKYGSPIFKTKYLNYIPTGKEHFKEVVDLVLYPMRKEIAKNYDLFINVTQNRLPAPSGIPAIHIIHFPDCNLDGVFPRNLAKKLNKRYIDSYSCYLPNSKFTQSYFEKYWGKTSKVLYAPIKLTPISTEEFEKKENIILAVDRLVRDKKVIEMIDAFCALLNNSSINYKFVIIGTPNPRQLDYYNCIKKKIAGKPIEIYSELSMEELHSWYKRAKIFWHAKGYNVDESEPSKMEHFGSTTVEAMISGCVPIVINKAGQKEIVEDESQGFKWNTIDELLRYTIQMITDDNRRKAIAQCAIKRGNDFLMPEFECKLNKIVKEVVALYENKNNS